MAVEPGGQSRAAGGAPGTPHGSGEAHTEMPKPDRRAEVKVKDRHGRWERYWGGVSASLLSVVGAGRLGGETQAMRRQVAPRSYDVRQPSAPWESSRPKLPVT